MSHTKNKYAAIFAMTFSVLFYFLVYVIRVEPGILANDLMAEFKMTSSTLGFMAAVLYMPYVAMQVPFGVIVDKLGVKLMTILCGSLCVIGTFIFGSASNVEQLEIGRFLIGLGSASAFICCGKTASEFFDKEKLSVLLGIAMFMGCLGGITGATPTACLVSLMGWRNTTYAIASFGVLLTVLAVLFMSGKKTP
ncbi:MAG: MFS transporter, partial [Holosporales bacterium]|nr:MFS transporter [Holosporales bacterium]